MIRGHAASAGDVDIQRETDSVLSRLTLDSDALQSALGRGCDLNFDEAMLQEQDALEMG